MGRTQSVEGLPSAEWTERPLPAALAGALLFPGLRCGQKRPLPSGLKPAGSRTGAHTTSPPAPARRLQTLGPVSLCSTHADASWPLSARACSLCSCFPGWPCVTLCDPVRPGVSRLPASWSCPRLPKLLSGLVNLPRGWTRRPPWRGMRLPQKAGDPLPVWKPSPRFPPLREPGRLTSLPPTAWLGSALPCHEDA